MEIIVGRNGGQPFHITDKSVSGKHLKLTTLPDGKVQVEDLGSTNGTFINGIQIISKIADRNTVVRMGPSYTFRISDIIPEVPSGTSSGSRGDGLNGEEMSGVDFDPEIIRAFNHLETVWTQYQAEKVRIQKNNASKNFLRMMPMFLLGGLGYLISCVPELASYRLVVTLAGLAIGLLITWISYQSATSLPEQMEKLNQQFQIDYVCPKCKQFLGFVPFEGLKNKGKCLVCKTKWVKQ